MYLDIKKAIQLLNEIKFEPIAGYKNFNFKSFNEKNILYSSLQRRSFSTTNKNKNETNRGIEYYKAKFDAEYPLKRAKKLKEFKKVYGGGYLGYTHIQNFGYVSQFFQTDIDTLFYIDRLESELKEYINQIPENVTYSILPVIRWQSTKGEASSRTISHSIKITRFTSTNLIAKQMLYDVSEFFIDYYPIGADLELYLMGRPWLKTDEFDLDQIGLTSILEEQIENKLSSFSKNSIRNTSDFSNLIKNYLYKDTFMNNYGEPLFNKNNNLIGYKLKGGQYVSIETYYNENNLLCNKVSIKEFDTINLSFIGEALTS
jgi:hypothetical protein